MQTVLAVFDEHDEANAAIDRLKELGFKHEDMSIIVKDNIITEQVGTKGGAAASGAMTGAATGGVIGGLAGLLIGIGAIVVPGIGGLLVGGPIAAALGLTGAAAATVTGATTGLLAGGLVGTLAGLGLPEDIAQSYETRIREGAILLAVPVNDNRDERLVEEVFARYNADQVRVLDTART